MREDTKMNTRYLKILASLFIVILSAFGGWAMSDGDNILASPGTTMNYDTAKALPGTPRVAQAGLATGTKTHLSVWTYSSIISSKLALGIKSRSRVPTNVLRPLFGQYY